MTRATDLPAEARAFLDALAIGESGGKDDDTAYSVYFGGSHFNERWPAQFPAWNGVWIHGIPTHAAGRYQFEPATWRGLGGGSFDPANQDHKAWQLACENYPDLKDDFDFNDPGILATVADALHSTWTSLNPDTFPQRYAECLAKLIA